MTLDWLILGGGIHGTYLSNVLVNALHVARSSVRVVDPNEVICHRWKQLTSNCGMRFLRSPGVHNLALASFDLERFQRDYAKQEWAKSIGKYNRPSLQLFNQHIDAVSDRNKLNELRVKATAKCLKRNRNGIRVETDNGDLLSKRVVLAVSSNETPLIPAWASGCKTLVRHAFESDFSLDWLREGDRIAVVGSGLTAAQIALHASVLSPGLVSLVVHRKPSVNMFDSEPCWMGPKCLVGFSSKNDVDKRLQIKQARHKGSVTPEIFHELNKAEKMGNLDIVTAKISNISADTTSSIARALDDRGDEIVSFNKMVLATGFQPGRPGGALIDNAIEEFNLPTAACGFPKADVLLRWNENIIVAGALAELSLGPASRNIIGARLAAQRITLLARH